MPSRRRIPLNEHASIVALMQEALAGEGPEEVIRRKCRDYVAYAKSKGWSGPRFDPAMLASVLGIHVEEMPPPWSGDGRIFSRAGQTVVEYRPDQPADRQRFTICHEIAHTCFPDHFRFVQHHNADAENDTAAYRRFEKLCNVGAGELLMPHAEFQADLDGRSVCFREACNLGSRYGASVDATIKRLLDFTEHPCAVAFLTDIHFEGFAPVPGRLRVRWFWKAKSFRGYLPAGTLTPKGSILPGARPQEEGFGDATKETWWQNNQPRSWYVEGLRLPLIPDNAVYPCVMALLHARRPR